MTRRSAAPAAAAGRQSRATNWPENPREQTIPPYRRRSATAPLPPRCWRLQLPLRHRSRPATAAPDADDDGDGLFDEDWLQRQPARFRPRRSSASMTMATTAAPSTEAPASWLDDDEDGSENEDPRDGYRQRRRRQRRRGHRDRPGRRRLRRAVRRRRRQQWPPSTIVVQRTTTTRITAEATRIRYDPAVYYLVGNRSIEAPAGALGHRRHHARSDGPVDGRDFVESTLAENCHPFPRRAHRQRRRQAAGRPGTGADRSRNQRKRIRQPADQHAHRRLRGDGRSASLPGAPRRSNLPGTSRFGRLLRHFVLPAMTSRRQDYESALRNDELNESLRGGAQRRSNLPGSVKQSGYLLPPVAVAIALIGILAFYSANQSAVEANLTAGELEAMQARPRRPPRRGSQHGLRRGRAAGLRALHRPRRRRPRLVTSTAPALTTEPRQHQRSLQRSTSTRTPGFDERRPGPAMHCNLAPSCRSRYRRRHRTLERTAAAV